MNDQSVTAWLLFNYKVPNEPSARRVFVWRKLRAMGAILFHDAAWVLPATPRTREKLQWLASEVQDMEGEAMLWEAALLFTGQDTDLPQQFRNQVDVLYRKILDALDRQNPDLASLSREFQQASAQDYFQSPLGVQVKQAILEKQRNNQ